LPKTSKFSNSSRSVLSVFAPSVQLLASTRMGATRRAGDSYCGWHREEMVSLLPGEVSSEMTGVVNSDAHTRTERPDATATVWRSAHPLQHRRRPDLEKARSKQDTRTRSQTRRQGELSANDRHRITLLQIGARVHHVRGKKETSACVNPEHIDLPVGRQRGPRSCLKSHGTNRSPPALGTQAQLQLLRGGLVPSETPRRRGRRIFLARPATPRP
jgi:hypothetical protein